jgi:hypothetical protein
MKSGKYFVHEQKNMNIQDGVSRVDRPIHVLRSEMPRHYLKLLGSLYKIVCFWINWGLPRLSGLDIQINFSSSNKKPFFSTKSNSSKFIGKQ